MEEKKNEIYDKIEYLLMEENILYKDKKYRNDYVVGTKSNVNIDMIG